MKVKAKDLVRISTDFPDVSQNLYEEKKLKEFKKNHPHNKDQAFTGFNIAVIFVVLFSSIVVGSSVAVIITENKGNIQKALYWIDSLPWTVNLLFMIFVLALCIGIFIVRSARKELKG